MTSKSLLVNEQNIKARKILSLRNRVSLTAKRPTFPGAPLFVPHEAEDLDGARKPVGELDNNSWIRFCTDAEGFVVFIFSVFVCSLKRFKRTGLSCATPSTKEIHVLFCSFFLHDSRANAKSVKNTNDSY